MNAPALEIERAYDTCDRITRREAANFYYGIRLLTRPKRQAMSAVYAFARRVDDIGDGNLAPEDALAALAAERAGLSSLAGDGSGAWNDVRLPSDGELDPVLLALAHARRVHTVQVPARAARRGLRGGGASQGRVRHLRHIRRGQQTLPPENPRPGLSAPRRAE